jgi:hypothetical protein
MGTFFLSLVLFEVKLLAKMDVLSGIAQDPVRQVSFLKFFTKNRENHEKLKKTSLEFPDGGPWRRGNHHAISATLITGACGAL